MLISPVVAALPERSAIGLVLALALASLLSLAASCGGAEVGLLDFGGDDVAYFFLVPLDAQGAPTRVSAVFGVRDRMLRFGGRPVLKLEPKEQSSIVVGLRLEQLVALHAGFDASRETEITAALGMPPVKPELRFFGASMLVDVALPPDVALYAEGRALSGAELEMARKRLRIRIVLSLPIDPEYCRARTNALAPFGRTEFLLPPTTTIPGEPPEESPFTSRWRHAQRVLIADADRVLVFTGSMVYVVRRGQGIELPSSAAGYDPTRPSAVVSLSTLGDPSAVARGIAIDRSRIDENGERTVLLAGGSGPGLAIWELKLSAQGLRFVSTATIVSRDEFPGGIANDLVIDDGGMAVAAGYPNVLFTRAAGARAFVPAEAPVIGEALEMQRIVSTGIHERPHLFSENRGRLFLGNAATHDWIIYRRFDRVAQVRYTALGAAADGQELWAGGLRSGFRKVGGGDWTLIQTDLPPRFSCADSPGPRVTFENIGQVTGLAIGPQSTYVAAEGCSSLLRLRRSDLCASVITGPTMAGATGQIELSVVDYRDGMLVAAGSFGALMVLAE